jgi:hypothetical protein
MLTGEPLRWLQLDEARAHNANTAVTVMSALSGVVFDHRDLQTSTHKNSFCGDLSNKQFSNNPRSLEELQHNAKQSGENTDLETLSKVIWNILKMNPGT